MNGALPPAGEVIGVRIGEMRVAEPPVVMSAVGVGSCVVVAIRDQSRGTGGMAHVMLPWLPRKLREGGNRFKYADYAIDQMVEKLIEAGGRRQNLGAKLVGGAHMFRMSRNSILDIGTRNVEATRRKLLQMGIPVLAEDVGGSWGRSVEMSLADGLLVVSSVRREVVRL